MCLKVPELSKIHHLCEFETTQCFMKPLEITSIVPENKNTDSVLINSVVGSVLVDLQLFSFQTWKPDKHEHKSLIKNASIETFVKLLFNAFFLRWASVTD